MVSATRFRLAAPRFDPDESYLARRCKVLLARRGYWVIRQHAGKALTLDRRRVIYLGEEGVPDYAVLHARHRNFLLELKRERGGRLSDVQEQKIAEIRQFYKLPIAVVDTVEDLRDWLEIHERAP